MDTERLVAARGSEVAGGGEGLFMVWVSSLCDEMF